MDLEPVAEPEPARPLAVGRAEVPHEARDDIRIGSGERLEDRPRSAFAEEAARVRESEAVARCVLEPGEVLEVRTVRDRLDASGTERAQLVPDRRGYGRDGVRVARDQPGDALSRGLLRADESGFDASVRVRGDRVAQVGDPAGAGGALDRGTDEVNRGGRRGRDDDVDSLAADDPDRGRDRRDVPADVLIRHQHPAERERSLAPRALEPLEAVELLRRQAAFRPDVADAVDPRLGRRHEVVVAVHPLGVVRREHVGLDSEAGEVGRELERPLDAAAARGREVHRREQHFHAGQAKGLAGNSGGLNLGSDPETNRAHPCPHQGHGSALELAERWTGCSSFAPKSFLLGAGV